MFTSFMRIHQSLQLSEGIIQSEHAQMKRNERLVDSHEEVCAFVAKIMHC